MKAHRLLYHPNLGLRVIKKKKNMKKRNVLLSDKSIGLMGGSAFRILVAKVFFLLLLNYSQAMS